MVPSRIHFHCTTTGTPLTNLLSVLSQHLQVHLLEEFPPTFSPGQILPGCSRPAPQCHLRISRHLIWDHLLTAFALKPMFPGFHVFCGLLLYLVRLCPQVAI